MAAEGRNTWACKRCSFENSLEVNRCEICYALHFSARKRRVARWACPACTFENVNSTHFCQICGTSRPVLPVSASEQKRQRSRSPTHKSDYSDRDSESSMSDDGNDTRPGRSGASSPKKARNRRQSAESDAGGSNRHNGSDEEQDEPSEKREQSTERPAKRSRTIPAADSSNPAHDANGVDDAQPPAGPGPVPSSKSGQRSRTPEAEADAEEDDQESEDDESDDGSDDTPGFCGLCFEAVGDTPMRRRCSRCSVEVHFSCVMALGMLWGKRWQCNCYTVGLSKKLDESALVRRSCLVCGQTEGILTCVQKDPYDDPPEHTSWVHVACAILSGYALHAVGDRFFTIQKNLQLNREPSQPLDDTCSHCRKDKTCGALLRCHMPGCTATTHFVCALRQRSFVYVSDPGRAKIRPEHARSRVKELLLVCPAHYKCIAARGRMNLKRMVTIEREVLEQGDAEPESAGTDTQQVDAENEEFEGLTASAVEDPHEAERHNLAVVMSMLVADPGDNTQTGGLNTVVYDVGDEDFAIAAEQQPLVEAVLPYSAHKFVTQFDFNTYTQSLFNRPDPSVLPLPMPRVVFNAEVKDGGSQQPDEVPTCMTTMTTSCLVSKKTSERLLEAMTCKHRGRALNILLELQEEPLPPFVTQLLQEAIAHMTDNANMRGGANVPDRARQTLRRVLCGVRRDDPLPSSELSADQQSKAAPVKPPTQSGKMNGVSADGVVANGKKPAPGEAAGTPSANCQSLPPISPSPREQQQHQQSAAAENGPASPKTPGRPPVQRSRSSTSSRARSASSRPRANYPLRRSSSSSSLPATTRQRTRPSFDALDVLATFAAEMAREHGSSSPAASSSSGSSFSGGGGAALSIPQSVAQSLSQSMAQTMSQSMPSSMLFNVPA